MICSAHFCEQPRLRYHPNTKRLSNLNEYRSQNPEKCQAWLIDGFQRFNRNSTRIKFVICFFELYAIRFQISCVKTPAPSLVKIRILNNKLQRSDEKYQKLKSLWIEKSVTWGFNFSNKSQTSWMNQIETTSTNVSELK